MSKFQVGDKVRPTSRAYGLLWVKGAGVVVPVDKDELNWAGEDTAVRWDNYDYRENWGNYHYAKSSDLELVTEADPASPDHYKFGTGAEVIDITRHLGFLEGNVIKYVARAGRKGENRREDLLKAQVYLRWALEDAG